MKYAAIADWATDKQFSVTFMCDQLGVIRQGYYRWLVAGPCQRERTDAELTETIREIHQDLHGHPGVRRVWAELVARGVRTARKRVWRLMRAAGVQGPHLRAWKKTTVAGLRAIDAPDLIGQDFTADAPAGVATLPMSKLSTAGSTPRYFFPRLSRAGALVSAQGTSVVGTPAGPSYPPARLTPAAAAVFTPFPHPPP